MSYAVRDPEIETKMREIADRITVALEGMNVGFALFLVEFKADGALFYISSAQRDDLVPVIEQWCARQRH